MSNEYKNQDMVDMKLIKVFPYLVLLFAIVGIVMLFIPNEAQDLGSALLRFSMVFVLGFCVLGTIFFLGLRGYRSNNRLIIGLLIITPVIAGGLYMFIGVTILPDLFDSVFFVHTGDFFEDLLVMVLEMYAIMALLCMAIYGVIFVVAAFFRQKISGVYKFMATLKNDGTDGRKGRFALNFYSVPDIIDIKAVEMEPVERDSFPFDAFVAMAMSIFLLSVMISSYIFLNPLFTSSMTIFHTLMIGMVMSIFIPALVMPWFITKETGTKIISQARPFYLWKGLKKRTYQSFFAISIVFFLLMMSLYMNADVIRMTYTYIGFVIFTGLISLTYSYVFFSRFNNNIKERIIKKFEE